jgi:hypothetical protein
MHLLGIAVVTRADSVDIAGAVALAAAGDDVAFASIVAACHEDMRRGFALVPCQAW